jgi:hypothetical protein
MTYHEYWTEVSVLAEGVKQESEYHDRDKHDLIEDACCAEEGIPYTELEDSTRCADCDGLPGDCTCGRP